VTPALPTAGLYVGGRWTDGPAGESLDVVNPATEEILGRAPLGDTAATLTAIEAARRAFDHGPWPRMTPAERADAMSAMGEVLRRRTPEIVELNIAEAGTVRALAASLQVGAPIEVWFDTARRVLPHFDFEVPLHPNIVAGAGVGQGVVVREPYGVAALITAFNYPFYLNVMKLAPALAAGCTAVLRPSPYTPFEAFLLAEVADEAGLPPGVLNVITGDVEAGRELTSHRMVDVVSFTGSDAVGRQVYRQAAGGLKKVILELGGKSANIVCDDADLSTVTGNVLQNFTRHAGQGCAHLTRTLVHSSLHDELVERLAEAIAGIVVGDPSDPATTMGPLIRSGQRERVEAHIAAALADGARLVAGGGRPAHLDRGFFVEPTLLCGVSNAMRIAREEIFGPVGVVIPFDDDDQAIALANDNDYGLAGGVWSADPARSVALARRIRTGVVHINGGGVGLNHDAAFGGYKASGVGREWGSWGLSEFLEHKTLLWSAR
jgi:aldehyde dehydrogenase (NAD+)